MKFHLFLLLCGSAMCDEATPSVNDLANVLKESQAEIQKSKEMLSNLKGDSPNLKKLEKDVETMTNDLKIIEEESNQIKEEREAEKVKSLAAGEQYVPGNLEASTPTEEDQKYFEQHTTDYEHSLFESRDQGSKQPTSDTPIKTEDQSQAEPTPKSTDPVSVGEDQPDEGNIDTPSTATTEPSPISSTSTSSVEENNSSIEAAGDQPQDNEVEEEPSTTTSSDSDPSSTPAEEGTEALSAPEDSETTHSEDREPPAESPTKEDTQNTDDKADTYNSDKFLGGPKNTEEEDPNVPTTPSPFKDDEDIMETKDQMAEASGGHYETEKDTEAEIQTSSGIGVGQIIILALGIWAFYTCCKSSKNVHSTVKETQKQRLQAKGRHQAVPTSDTLEGWDDEIDIPQ